VRYSRADVNKSLTIDGAAADMRFSQPRLAVGPDGPGLEKRGGPR
jgi:hypothetical protein